MSGTKEEIQMSFLEGTEFNVIQPVGVNVVAFAVNFTRKEQWSDSPLCTLEKLDYVESAVDGRIQRTFSIPYSDEPIRNVVILSLAKTRCVIGYGKVENNKFVEAKETLQLQYSNYAQENVEGRNFNFTFNPKRQIALIDVDDGKQVFPTISKPDVFGNLHGTYKLVPYRNYVALEMSVNIKLPKTNESEDLENMML